MTLAVYGLGNVLRRDDGFGPSTVRHLEALWDFPDEVEVRDLGTPGLDLASWIVGRDAVIFVDAARGAGLPGKLRVFHRDELVTGGQPPPLTGHEGDVRAALRTAELAGDRPIDATLIGVVPGDTGDGTGLTPAVEAAIAAAAGQVLRELRRRGVRVGRRTIPLVTGDWWRT